MPPRVLHAIGLADQMVQSVGTLQKHVERWRCTALKPMVIGSCIVALRSQISALGCVRTLSTMATTRMHPQTGGSK
eukprot:706532-Amphidinium_carterae.1